MGQMRREFVKEYGFYLVRWQLTTPILWLITSRLNSDPLTEAVLANLIGGLIFYFVDRELIFHRRFNAEDLSNRCKKLIRRMRRRNPDK
jgi:hypothetical protein